MNVTFRPMATWPHPETPERNRRGSNTFKAAWSDTLSRLEYEIGRLRGSNIIVGATFHEREITRHGWPYANARPWHPGIEVSFDTRAHGRLVYATDVCTFWQHNIRSIALGLRALRDVDRFGIAATGQQYAGWRALPSGIGRGVVFANTAEAWTTLIDAIPADALEPGGGTLTTDAAYRLAARHTHPDTGGDPERFLRVQAAYEMLRAMEDA